MNIKLKNTKLVDEYKRPILFFHTSPVENIEHFLPLSHFGTKKAANMRRMHFVYQTLKVPEPAVLPEELPHEINQKFLSLKNAPKLFTYPVYLYSKSALKIPDLGKHSLAQYKSWFLNKYAPKQKFLTGKERLEGDGVGETKTLYKKALTEFIFENPFCQSEENLKKELASETVFIATNDPSNLAKKVALQRMILFLEKEGYDAFIYKNDYEDKNKESFIIFRPEQVFFQNKKEEEHTLPKENPFLVQQEKDFFQKRNILSPTERIVLHQSLLKQKRGNNR